MSVLASVALAPAVLAAGPGGGGGSGSDCPSWNPPNEMMIVQGDPQLAQLGKPFQTSLQVELANTNGCPLTGGTLSGVWVGFTAPSSGASGSFASSGTNTVTVGTNSGGVATAPTFTANDTAGTYKVLAGSGYGTVSFNLANTDSGLPASIAATGTTAQEATVGTQYAQPLAARVVDGAGKPVQGATVTFTLPQAQGSAGASFLGGSAQASVQTDAGGLATSPPLLANSNSGNFSATASVTGVSTPLDYPLRNLPARLLKGSSATRATVRARYRRPLAARVLDQQGRPIAGANVTFTLPQSQTGAGASFADGSSQATATSDASGRASSPPLVANSTAGRFVATASAGGGSVRYALRNVAGRPATVTAGAASGESTATHSVFPIRLAVTVKDADGNPVAGARVTFTAPARGPSGHFRLSGRRPRKVHLHTNADGIAVAPPFVANARAGGYAVVASAAGRHAAFALVNRAR